MNHQWSWVCEVKIHVSFQLVCTIACTATGGWNRAPYAAWRSLLRTPVPLHLAPRIYCDPMRPRTKGRARTYCLSTSLCSRAQKSNRTLRALHRGVWWRRITETKKGKRKFDKLHVIVVMIVHKPLFLIIDKSKAIAASGIKQRLIIYCDV